MKFSRSPNDGEFFIDGRKVVDPYACEIEDGTLQGIYLFTCKDRAEEFCWSNGFEFELEEDEGVD